MQDVVAGKRRTRRRGGAGGLLGSDESDDEDDEEARTLRQRLAKKRRVEGDTLDALARNPATASFHATYQMALLDDAEEFAHLDRDEELQEDEEEPGRDRTQDREGGESEEDEEGDGQKRRGEEGADEDVEMADSELPAREEKRARKEEISAAEVRKALQEVARGERVRSHPLLLFLENLRVISRVSTGISRARSGGRVLDGSRAGGGRRRRDIAHARAHSALHQRIQSTAPPRTAHRRRHGRCPRTFSHLPS